MSNQELDLSESPADIPIDGGTKLGYAINWPVILRGSIAAPLPVTAEQVYEGFAQYFRAFEALDPWTRRKSQNTAAFMNASVT